MKVKCPVAGCDYIIKGADDGFKHWQKYDEFHKTLHWNWLNYFSPEIAKSDMPDTVKFRLAYKKWHEDQKKLKIQKKDRTVEDYGQGRFKRGTISELMGDLHR